MAPFVCPRCGNIMDTSDKQCPSCAYTIPGASE